MSAHFSVRVYYEDTDFSGNVYHAAYLKFFERARTEWLRAMGIHHSELAHKDVVFAVRHMEISFDRPARIDDLLDVETSVVSMSGARAVLSQVLRKGDEMLCRAKVTVVALTPSTGRPTRLPAPLRALGTVD